MQNIFSLKINALWLNEISWFYYATLRNGVYVQKHFYLNSILSIITKHGTKLIPVHNSLILLLDMQIILYTYS